MDKIFKLVGGTLVIGVAIVAILAIMAYTRTGFVIIDGWEVGVKKSGTKYEMEELQPGYKFFMPLYTTIDDVNGRPVMFNWSKSDAHTESTHEMRHSSMITGVDKSGIPLSFALAMEITPVKDMMAEMYQETGSYENAIVKKAIQPAKSIIKDIMGEFDAKDIQSKRGDVSGMLNKRLMVFFKENKYFKLDSTIDLKEIEVPQKVLDKQLEVQTAKQNVEIEKQNVLKAKQEAEKKAAVAKGEADRARIEAQGRADAVTIEAKAQAQANDLLDKSLTTKVLKLNAIDAWKAGGSQVPQVSETIPFMGSLKELSKK